VNYTSFSIFDFRSYEESTPMLDGLISLPWWGYILATLALTHVTIAGVTIYLHRHQAHRALDLHPLVSHFFRFWLWLTTGMITREWAAIHRKHHARVDTPDDPHSPLHAGIRKVLWSGASLYRKEARNRETIQKYGHGAPDDWLERNLYTPHNGLGIVLMLIIDVLLFGLVGLAVWAVQMIWIPFWAAGVINGIGHYWGYRNYEVADASTNIVPWGILIGGEELHNNHHTYASSAKFSSKWWEIDLGWAYIRLLSASGLARVKKTAPRPAFNPQKQHCDIETVKAVVANRFQIMARFAREVMQQVHREELRKADPDSLTLLKRAKRLLVREVSLIDEDSKQWLRKALEHNRTLDTVYHMKENLQDVWQRSAATQEQLLQALEDWCRQAEATGIDALREFSRKLRTYTLTPT
jgi:stearoyl-CoA desaturase (delta-9 desaturase)